jgi:hypothetical protein
MSKNNVCPVPLSQRPINEYKTLKNSLNFAWTINESEYFFKDVSVLILFLVCFSSVIVISSQSKEINIFKFIIEILLSSLTLSVLVLSRFYLAWNYIYKRLMNATISYEESGWYDGQTWVKTSEILMQDRLIGTYELLPKITRLEITLKIFLFILSVSMWVFLKI